MRPALVVGLTGGIASGKSTVTAMFTELGVTVIDADVLAREVVQPGQSALAEVVAAFGPAILAQDGTLDRSGLRALVFEDPTKRKRLEAILHPRIRAATRRRVEAVKGPYCIVSIPLLLETGQTDLVDRVLVVDASPEQQLSRARQRDGSAKAVIEGIMDAQIERSERLAAADDIIRNDADRERLRAQVTALHQRYLDISAGHLPANNN